MEENHLLTNFLEANKILRFYLGYQKIIGMTEYWTFWRDKIL